MAFAQLFDGFLPPVAVGSLTVFALLFIIGIRTPRHSTIVVTRKTSR